MRINNNIMALNAHRQLGVNQTNASKSMERLSSGMRINRAGDDAAGLAISEKMRGQIRGLKQAARNAQDGISLIQTAEGALNETHAILQRMRELANQAANDTNVGVDRGEIQKEINALTSEINRIGNTTEFNTQSLLKGDGGISIDKSGITGLVGNLKGGATTHVQAKADTKIGTAAVNGDTLTFRVGDGTTEGHTFTITFVSDGDAAKDTATVDSDSVTANSATIALGDVETSATMLGAQADAIAAALNAMIAKSETLAGNYSATSDNTDTVTLEAVSGGDFEGGAGYVAAATADAAGTLAVDTASDVGSTSYTAASTTIDFVTDYNTQEAVKALVGTGLTIDGVEVEFYNANDGVYTGDALGINISAAVEADDGTNATALASALETQLSKIDGVSASAAGTSLTITATDAIGEAGNNIEIVDGGVQANFTSKLQVGSNEGQSMTIEIADMRASALKLTGSGDLYTSTATVTDGTSSVLKESALDVSSHESAAAALTIINNAIETVSAQRSELGAFQNRLEHTISNLGTSAENLQAAESRIRDLDMADEIMAFTKNNILQQAATAMLAQANMAPQSVLQLLG